MASRFGSNLHLRDPRADLFKNFSADDDHGRRGGHSASATPSRNPSPYGGSGSGSGSGGSGGGYGYATGGGGSGSGSGYGYAAGAGAAQGRLGAAAADSKGYRPATPNSRGQYSSAVLSELESQNEDEVESILGKVKVLKDMTMAIGDEIRESSALAGKMNDTFDRTRLRLRGTTNRMLLMARRSGVPWKVWLAFFAAVILLFMYVWLF